MIGWFAGSAWAGSISSSPGPKKVLTTASDYLAGGLSVGVQVDALRVGGIFRFRLRRPSGPSPYCPLSDTGNVVQLHGERQGCPVQVTQADNCVWFRL